MTAPDGDVDEMIRHARKRPIASVAGTDGGLLDRAAIEAALPHRGRFLLLDEVSYRSDPESVIVARHRFTANELAGHFPGDPMWPGVLQVEAIGQAGALLAALQADAAADARPILTTILQAHFLAAVRPPADVQIVARLHDDGLFFTIVGQCLQGSEIRSVAALRGLRGGS